MPEQQVFALVIMPFDPKFDDVYRIGIQEAASSLGIRAERLDDMIFAEGMMERLYDQVQAADIVIAEMSEKNVNVFYEVGYADAKDKLCILLTRDTSDLPFDLRHRRHIVYGNSIVRLREQLTKNLQWALQQLPTTARPQLRFECRSEARSLAIQAYSIEGTLRVTADMFNESGRQTIELHAVYLYLNGEDWRLSQMGRECPLTRSGVEAFKHKYFLVSPVSRIHKGGWVQIQVDGIRVLGSRWSGQPLNQVYTCRDEALLQVVTETGTFETPLFLEAEFQEESTGHE